MIREATAADMPALLVLARAFHKASPYAPLPFSESSVAEIMGFLIGGGGGVLVLDDEGVRGAIGLVLAPVVFNKALVQADEMFWWCEGGGGLDLLKAAEAWACKVGAFSVTMSCLENDRLARMSKLYERLGYAAGERHFRKVL